MGWMRRVLEHLPGLDPIVEEPPAPQRTARGRPRPARPAQDPWRDVGECRCAGPVPPAPLVQGFEGKCGRCHRPRPLSRTPAGETTQ